MIPVNSRIPGTLDSPGKSGMTGMTGIPVIPGAGPALHSLEKAQLHTRALGRGLPVRAPLLIFGEEGAATPVHMASGWSSYFLTPTGICVPRTTHTCTRTHLTCMYYM